MISDINLNAIPCQKCIDETVTPIIPIPCQDCSKNCYCYGSLICNFCLRITGHKLKSKNILEFMTNFPCYCCSTTPDYILLCLDCQQNYCECDNKSKYLPKFKRKYHCAFCFEKEYNQIIKLARIDDFPIKK
jgi:hypothetical protein